MSVNRLYPPILAGTIPSFYTTTTGTSLEVPFSMNATVNKNAVRGIQLRLRTTSTDIVLADVESGVFGADSVNRSVIYNLDNSIVSQLVVGNFYKIQLAYVDTNGVKGYYSTVAIVKYTKKPEVVIAGLNMQSATTISDQAIVGQYKNADISEKVYQYRFVLMASDNTQLEDTGWLLHNTQNDTEQDGSQDQFVIKHNLTESQVYRIQYSITTNNGLKEHSVIYDIVKSTVMGAAIDVSITPSLDYENGRIVIAVKPVGINVKEYPLMGSYVLTRRDAKNNSTQWEVVKTSSLNVMVSKDKPYLFYDYSIEAGGLYIYSLQKFNSNNIYSRRVTHINPISAQFEDAFLYDGTRQLRIRFNPNVSSFKSVVAETKKTTLGRQYPFILRNGILNYKEFPITGLISYQMDNDELFLSKSNWEYISYKYNKLTGELIERKKSPFEVSTQLTDENFDFERLFKLEVLEWLNNGSIKLFKSPQEGNYIVRLTNVSLTPNATVSRMLHTFNCTASEVAKYSVDALSEYSLLGNESEDFRLEETTRIHLQDIYDMLNGDATRLATYDLTQGRACYKIKFYTSNNNEYKAYGLTFQWGEYNFAIDRSGEYTLELDDFMQAPLYVLNLTESSASSSYLELSLEASDVDSLDAISSSNVQYMYGYGVYGIYENMEYPPLAEDKSNANTAKKFSRNIFRECNNLKTAMSQILWMEYHKIPVYEIDANTEYDTTVYDHVLSAVWHSPTLSAFGPAGLYYRDDIFLKANGKYYRYVPKDSHFQRDKEGALPIPVGPGKTGAWFEEVTNYGTSIIIGDLTIDIDKLDTDSSFDAIFDHNTEIPLTKDGELILRIQPGVKVMFFGKNQTDTYFVESEKAVITESKAELAAYEEYCMYRFNFVKTTANAITETDYPYVFQNRIFVAIAPSDATDWQNAGYAIYKPYWPSVYSEATIRSKYLNYIVKKETLDEKLRLNLGQGAS